MVTMGLAIMTVALMAMTALPLVGIVHKHTFNATMILNVTGLGVFMPTATAAALLSVTRRAGTAASLQGAIQMAGGVGGTLAVGALQHALPMLAMPLALHIMLALAVTAYAVLPALGR